MAQATTTITSVPAEPDLPPDELAPDDNAPTPDNDRADIEARAREMGWKPLAEYRGPVGGWRDAPEFVERGETVLPIVREQNRDLRNKVGRLESEIGGLRSKVTELTVSSAEQLQIIKELREMGQRANQAGYNRAMADIRAKQRQAVETGDTKAYDQLVEQAEALQDSRSQANGSEPPRTVEPPAPPTPASPAAPQLSAPTQTFIAENPWFRTNKLLGDTMIAFHQEVLNERRVSDATLAADPDLETELLEEAKARVMEKYPERFGAAPREPARRTTQPRRAAVAQPTPPDTTPRAPATQTTINSIQDPEERKQVREAFNRLKRQLPETTEAEYMALYTDPHADVLSLQRQPRK